MMKLAAAFLASALAVAALAARADEAKPAGIVIVHGGSRLSVQGAGQRFTGSVRIDPLFQSDPPARQSGGLVTFEPGVTRDRLPKD